MATSSSLQLTRAVILTVAFSLAVFLGLFLPEMGIMPLFLVVGLVYLFTIPLHYRWAAVIIIATFNSAFIFPAIGGPGIWEVAAYVAYPSLLAVFVMRKLPADAFKFRKDESAVLFCLLGLAFVFVTLMFVRGAGLNVLGSEKIGGRAYFTFFGILIVPILFLAMRFSRRDFTILFWLQVLLAFTWMITDFVLHLGLYQGPLRSVFMFFDVSADSVAMAMSAGDLGGMTRIQSLSRVSINIVTVLLLTLPMWKLFQPKWIWLVPITAVVASLGLISGHRTTTFFLMVIPSMIALLQGFFTPRNVITSIGVGGALVAALYVSAPSLPVSAQRAVSFLPGIEAEWLAAKNAEQTLSDRMFAIQMGLEELDQYWLIGRGIGYENVSPEILNEMGPGMRMYLAGNFFNGFFSTFLLAGLPGLLCVYLFFFLIAKMGLEIVGILRKRGPQTWGSFDLACFVLVGIFLSEMLFYTFLQGHLPSFGKEFIVYGSLILVARRLVEQREREEAEGPPPPHKPDEPAPAKPLNYHPAGSIPNWTRVTAQRRF